MKKTLLFILIALFSMPRVHTVNLRHHANAACLVVGSMALFGCTGALIKTWFDYEIEKKLQKIPLTHRHANKEQTEKRCLYLLIGALASTGVYIYGLGNVISHLSVR